MWGSTKLMSGQIWPLGHQLAVACLEGLEVKDPSIMFFSSLYLTLILLHSRFFGFVEELGLAFTGVFQRFYRIFIF